MLVLWTFRSFQSSSDVDLVWNSTCIGAPSPSSAKLRAMKGTNGQIADILLRLENTLS